MMFVIDRPATGNMFGSDEQTFLFVRAFFYRYSYIRVESNFQFLVCLHFFCQEVIGVPWFFFVPCKIMNAMKIHMNDVCNLIPSFSHNGLVYHEMTLGGYG